MRSSMQGAMMAAACQDVSISYTPIPSSALIHWHIQLQKGADGACGDDANTLKSSVASWLNEQDPHPVPLFAIREKQGRGFNHDITGRLLCPVDYDWFDPS
jgi:hypothetical protein